MATYYYRAGTSATGTYQIEAGVWSFSSSPTVGIVTPSTSDFSNPANEFIIDNLSGGTFSNPIIINVGINKTIANLSFGGLNTDSNNNYSVPVFNVAANVILTISSNLKLPNRGNGSPGYGALYINTNTTGKIFVTGNFLVGANNNDSSQNFGVCPVYTGSIITETVIEIGGSTGTAFIKGTFSGVPNTAFKVNTICSVPTGYSKGNFKLKFTKSSSAQLIFQVNDFLIPILAQNTIMYVESDYDTTAKASFPNRYGSGSTYGNGIHIPSLRLFSFGTVETDLKELGINTLFAQTNLSTSCQLINSLSSLKVGFLEIQGNSSLFLGGTSSTTTILEILGNLTKTTATSNNAAIIGAGKIKFIGSLDSNINVPLYTSSGDIKGIFNIDVEIAKTGSAKVICSNLNSDFYFGYGNSPITPISSTKTFTHTSGIFECTKFYTLADTVKSINFVGNSNTSVISITNLYLNSNSSASPSFKYNINTYPLKVTNLYIQGNSPTVINNISILGNKGFTIDNFYHTTAVDNAAGKINNVILSNDPTAVYTVNNSIEMLGLSTRRAILKGDSTSIINLPNTLASNNILTTTTSPSLTTRHYISQNPINTGLFKRTPSSTFTGSDITQQSSFAKISGGSGNNWTLNRNVGTITSRGFEAGIPAIFNYNGLLANLNINYINTFDIDSSAGSTTIKADNSYQNRVGIPNPNLWRTINWDSLTPLIPLVTVAYVE